MMHGWCMVMCNRLDNHGREPPVFGNLSAYRGVICPQNSQLRVDEHAVMRLRVELEHPLSSALLVQAVSRLLSEVTHLAGIVTLPKREQFVLRQVEFGPEVVPPAARTLIGLES